MTWFKQKKKISKLKLELKQKKVGELIDTMLKSNLDIHYAPLSQEYFILDRERSISICISDSSVRISNHKYLYEVPFSLNVATIYINKVRDKIQEKAESIKKDLFRNEVDLINQITKIYETDK